METCEKLAYYTGQYGMQVALSLPYFALASFVGFFLLLRRASLFGLVLSAAAQLSFVVGLSLHLFSHQATELMQAQGASFAFDLLHADLFLFPLTLGVMLPLIIFMSRGFFNAESVLVAMLIFFMGLIPLANKLAGGTDVMLLKAYFTEILYTPREVMIHYLAYAAVIFAFLIAFFRKAILAGFDPLQARLSGTRVEAANVVFYFIAGFALSICVRVLGIYVAMMAMVVPALLALSFFKSIRKVAIAAVGFSLFFALTGFGISFRFDSLPTEPTIITIFGIAAMALWVFFKTSESY